MGGNTHVIKTSRSKPYNYSLAGQTLAKGGKFAEGISLTLRNTSCHETSWGRYVRSNQRRYDRVKESRLITTLITFVLLLDISVHFIWSFMQCKVKVHDVLLKLPYRACFTEGTAAI